MTGLAVIGNISRDRVIKPHTRYNAPGGAAFHVSVAASAAGLPTAPVAVIGDDLTMSSLFTIPSPAMDLSAVVQTPGRSASFKLTYDADDELIDLQAHYGVAVGLTEHAVSRIEAKLDSAYHVCCRAPLEVARVLATLIEHNAAFSVDFIISSAPDLIGVAAPALPLARHVFTNAAEYQWLSDTVPAESLPAVVVSDGARTTRMFRYGELVASVDPPKTTAVRVTGAGDTLAGVFLAGVTAGLTDSAALQRAVAAASNHTATHGRQLL